jgi:hypothetical protein
VSTPPDRSSRIASRVNLELLATKQVVVVGIGSVGSQVAKDLANYIGRLRLFDGKPLEEHHLPRHALRKVYVGQNKAVSMEHYLSEEIPTLQVEARPWQINSTMPDDVFDVLLHDADLIIAATDNREVQRAIGRRALALDIPAIFPGLYERNGGEVFMQLSPERPCFLCRDHFRLAHQELRGVAATNPDILTIIALTSQLSLAVLDPDTDYRRLLVPERGERWPPQLFVHNDLVLAKHIVPWHQGCPSCAVGPSPLRPDARDAWEAGRRARAAEVPATLEPQPMLSIRDLDIDRLRANWQTFQDLPTVEPVDRRSLSAQAEAEGRRRAIAILACVAVAILIFVISRPGSHKLPAEVSKSYRITVDYSQSLTNMMADSGLQPQEGEPPIEQLFSVEEGPAEVQVVLVRLTGLANRSDDESGIEVEPGVYTEWITTLHKLGFRPATLPELLALAEQYPSIRQKSRVVELGSLAARPNIEGLEYGEIVDGYLDLPNTSESGDIEGSAYEFAAVRN